MDIVVHEPRVYDERSPFSFYKDLVAVAHGSLDAEGRLRSYRKELQHEVEQNSVEGRRVLRARVNALRQKNPDRAASEIMMEARAGTSSSMAGFTTPQYILDQYALFRGTQRAFVDQTMKLPLPGVGLVASIPSFTSTASAGQQSEGGAVTETDPSGQYQSANVVTMAGQVIVSQQLEDRASTQGFTYDYFVYEQLRQQYDQAVNTYVLGQALSRGASVTESAGTFSLANFYQDIAACREKLQDTAGTRLAPTHVFTTPDLYGYATRQLDSNGRPLITPEFAPGNPLWPDSNIDQWKQFTGTVLPGTLMWFVDPTIQPSGSNTYIIVSNPSTIVTMEGDEPLLRVFNQTLANTLQTVIQLYNYVVSIPRFPSGTAFVTGAAYPTTLV